MHTLKVILVGCALLAVCLAVGRGLGGPAGLVTAVKVFFPLWLAGAAVNLWLGTRAGYTVVEELPIALVVFAVPALVAGAVWWWLARG
jgi:hypothetical protein